MALVKHDRHNLPLASPHPQGGALALAAAAGSLNEQRHVSSRRPSVTLAFLLMKQLQFLATLSLVDYAVSGDSMLSGLVLGLR